MNLCPFRLIPMIAAFALTVPVYAADPVAPAGPAADTKHGDAEGGNKERAKPAFEVMTIKDVAYRIGDDADDKRHRLDLYLPKGEKDFPVLIFVHGGSWRSGSKDEYTQFGETFAGDGIGTVIVNYRLSPKVHHPAHIEDVAAAFAWTYRRIGEFGGRADCIFVSGHSAGGHLAALLATDEKYLKKEQLTLDAIHGVISISGVHQIFPLLPMFRNVFGRDRDECKMASPLTHVRNNHPPFLLLYAANDLPTLGTMSEDMHRALRKHKCESECIKVARRDHMSILVSMMKPADDTRLAMYEFVGKHSDWKPPVPPDDTAEPKKRTRKKDTK